MGNFGAFFGKAAGKISNAANGDRKLWCYNCKEITDQIAVGYADTVEADGGNEVGSALASVYDYIPVLGPVTAGNPYCCTVCNKIRIHGGILSRTANNDRKKRGLL